MTYLNGQSLYSILKKLAKQLALKVFILGRPIIPKLLTAFTFFYFTNIKLQLENKKQRKNIAICKYKYGTKGALCLSVDFDLYVGPQKIRLLKDGVVEVLRVAEKHDTHVTWGICGTLALSKPEIFQQIIDSSIPHDLGAHTFSHIDFSQPSCTTDIAKNEIEKCIKLLEKIQRPVAFIFPWNKAKYLHILKKLGFIAFRGNQQNRLTYPHKQEGLWNIPKTYHLTEKSANEINFIKKLVDLAVAYHVVLHFWSHPWSMTINGDASKFTAKVLEPLLSYAKQKQDEGLLWICTMRELANYCEARENCHINHIEKTKDKISFSAHCKINDPRFDFPPTITLQIQIPRKWKNTKVFVDDIEQKPNSSFYIAKRKLKQHLLLTLSFQKPRHQVYLLKAL